MQSPQRLLNNYTQGTYTKHSPQPLILAKLLDTGPEAVLVLTELFELSKLLRLGCRVPTLLVLALLCISAEVSQEGVVGDGAEEFDWGEHVGAVEHDDEGDVNEGVAKVAVLC